MPAHSAPRGREARTDAPRSDLRRVWVIAGLAVLGLDLLFTVPGNPVLDFNRPGHRTLGTLVSHLGMLALLVGLWPCRRRWLESACDASRGPRIAAIAIAAPLPLVAIVALGQGSPAYAHALTKEWGIIEPSTMAIYLATAWVALQTARLRRARGWPWRPFALAALACVVLSLEETDYFGIPSALIGGRIGRVYVGSLHDLVNLATWYPVVLPFLGLFALVVAGVAWRMAGLSWRFLWTELRHHSTWLMILAVLVIVVAEVVDVVADVPIGLEWLFRSDIEEPLEMGAAVLMGSGILLKHRRDRAAAGHVRDG